MTPLRLSTAHVRTLLLRAAGLAGPEWPSGRAGARQVLERMGEIQLDPIDRIGTNADLVLHARVDGLVRGDSGRLGDTFEHFAKERCLLPARRLPVYRAHAAEAPWWQLSERLRRLDAGVLDRVWEEVHARGPLSARELGDHGSVQPIDWSGWKGTSKAATMALEVLWTRCRVVVVGRNAGGDRVYDIPERALAAYSVPSSEDFFLAGLRERIGVAGLLRTAGGPQWSALAPARNGPVVDALLRSGEWRLATVEGGRRTYFVASTALDQLDQPLEGDARLRLLAPLDPLLWDRPLVEAAFGFAYVWEVYKPAAERKWGYYVCPLLWDGQLVGRIEARRGATGIEVTSLVWEDHAPRPHPSALDALLHRLTLFQGA